MRTHTKNVNSRRGGSAAAFLTHSDVRRGYADAVVGDSWPDSPTMGYEWGRLMGAEVRSLMTAAAPRQIPPMKRITKEWQSIMNSLPEFRKMVNLHHSKIR